jgi:hypothetical protein
VIQKAITVAIKVRMQRSHLITKTIGEGYVVGIGKEDFSRDRHDVLVELQDGSVLQ